MDIRIFSDSSALATAAAAMGADLLRQALKRKATASIVVATGASQLAMLSALVKEASIDWSRVRIFHLDEYIGLPMTHPASFRNYLMKRLIAPLGSVGEFVPVNGDVSDIASEIERLNARIGKNTIDVCFAGIGENGHLAFNDPPADFETESPFIVVDLDERCRRQQLGEGWFPTLDDVPRQALSMSIRQIMKSTHLIVSVPDARKAEAVRATVEEVVSAGVPATILRMHPRCTLFLDDRSAARLSKRPTAVHETER